MGKWETVRIGDVFDKIKNGVSIKQERNQGSGYPITRIETISDGIINRKKMGYAGILDINRYKDNILQNGDILMSHINSVKHLGKTAIYDQKDSECIIHGMNLLRLVPKEGILNSYFANYFFTSHEFKKQILKITKNSVNQSSFNIAALKNLLMPLPGHNEQKEIVERLDRSKYIISNRIKQIEKLDLLIKSQYNHWIESNVGYCSVLKWRDLFNTTTGKLDSNAMCDGGVYPFFTCAKEIYSIDTYAFDTEALLLAGNNAAAIYDVKHYKGKFNAYQRTYVITLKDELYKYEVFKIQLEQKLAHLKHVSEGTNTKYLTLSILNNLEFTIPPIELQNQFSAFVQQVEQQKSLLQQSLTKMEENYKSLMQKCFRGEIFN